MSDDIRWERLATFPAAYSADMARQRLEAEGIPVVVLNDQTGIFGPGFSGATAVGVTLLAASDRMDEARELIEDLLEPYGGDLASE